jgi:hypothetical protein
MMRLQDIVHQLAQHVSQAHPQHLFDARGSLANAIHAIGNHLNVATQYNTPMAPHGNPLANNFFDSQGQIRPGFTNEGGEMIFNPRDSRLNAGRTPYIPNARGGPGQFTMPLQKI